MAKFKQYLRKWGYTWLLLLGVGVLIWWQERHLVKTHQPAPMVEQPVVMLDGTTQPLLSTKHRGTIIFFFAPWCKICHFDMDTLSRFAKNHPDIAIRLVALSWQDRNELIAYQKRHTLRIPIVLGNEALAEAYRVEAFPTYYFVDRSGVIRSRSRGYATYLGLWWRSLWSFTS